MGKIFHRLRLGFLFVFFILPVVRKSEDQKKEQEVGFKKMRWGGGRNWRKLTTVLIIIIEKGLKGGSQEKKGAGGLDRLCSQYSS